MTYLEDRETPELPRRRRHSHDDADAEQYVYQRPADWQPRRRRTESFEDLGSYEAPTEATPVDWWGGSSPRSWDEESAAQARWDAGRRQVDSAWDADALRAAAGVPYREPRARGDLGPLDRGPADRGPDGRGAYDRGPVEHGTVDFGAGETAPMAPVPHAYEIPDQRRPAESHPEFDAADPEVPPAVTKRSLPRKHLILRIAAVMVLVFSAAIGVAMTVLNDADPDTVQVKEDLQANAPAAEAPATADADAAAEQEQQQKAADAQARQEQDAAVDAAKSRATDRAAAAQKSAAKEAERADDQRASRAEARKAAAPVEESSSSSSSGKKADPVPEGPADCSGYSGNKKTGCSLLSEFGFATSQMSCLEKLWDKESTWRETAQNPSSGAYGIPQALPASKMGSVASDYMTNPATQIRWGLGYIKGRYSTPCGAWSHSQANGWY